MSPNLDSVMHQTESAFRRFSIVPVLLLAIVGLYLVALTACGGEETQPETTPVTAPDPTGTPIAAETPRVPATATPEPTAAPATENHLRIGNPKHNPPPAHPPRRKKRLRIRKFQRPPNQRKSPKDEMLSAYAAERANGPGAIFVGDPSQLIGPPPHDGLMFRFPADQYNLLSGAALLGSPELHIPSHMFIYTSDYYRNLITKANLTNPTELVSSGEEITIQHVCIDRQLAPCVLIQSYLAPNIARRTNGQVTLNVTSFVELQIDGQETLSQVGIGTLDMVNIYTGYVAGEAPVLEIQSLWGSAADWETSYLSLTDLAEDVDRLIEQETNGSQVFNRNWFAGADQWIYSNEPLAVAGDFEGLEIRVNSASQSDFIRGMGGDSVFTSLAELYTSLDQGIVDAAVYGALLAPSAKLFEVTGYMSGPLIGFGYTNNVINKDVWDEIPEDLQQIMIEEGAKAELEGLRLAPFQNVAAVAINQQVGMQTIPFSPEIQQYIQQVVVPEYVIPGWLGRLGFPGRNEGIVEVYNKKSSPYSGIWINEDGSIGQVEVTKGTSADQ